MIAPTPCKSMVGIDAENGKELWRFKPEGRPAYRGLIYWPGNEKAKDRVAGQVVGQASRLSVGRLALEDTNAGETPGAAGETPAPLPGLTGQLQERVLFCASRYLYA